MHKFIVNQEALMKNVFIKDDTILASDENYENEETFLDKVNTQKKSFLDTHIHIKIKEITKFILEEKELAIQLFFKKGNKNSKTYFQFNDISEYTAVKEYFLYTTNFSLKKESSNSFSSWIKQALYTIIAFIMTIITFNMARSIESGDTVSISGGKRGLKRLMLLLAESLGTTNTIVVGSLVVMAFLYWTYTSYKKGKKEIEFYS
ncbi:hypothetical protein [Tenacibaculum jejuense]|uniref:Uncharacterized protein n=1 Tax=Tenacibaculum jejuense TaxID=584609 RepID=A0A238UDB5_9FLAO|nr:hypothetical protein [Tenacibaculum jejuense]SNR17016.1 conserved protein of unknown function [Tenacibaculum jejuense]